MSLSAKKALGRALHEGQKAGLQGLGVPVGPINKATEIHTWRPVLSMAGFRNQSLDIAVAIIAAESGGDAKARGKNSDGTVDRGGVQFNSKWHAEVSDKCADDPVCAAKAFYRVSSKGKDFGQWSTFKSGAYKAHFKRGGDIPIKNGKVKGGIDRALDGVTGAAGDAIGGVDDAVRAIGMVAEVIVNPTKLGELAANGFAWWMRLVGKAVYKWVILPPWHWTERAVTYYFEVEMDDGNKALLTLAFWATGYAVLFARVDEEPSLFAKPNATPLGRTLGTFRDMAKRPKLHSPKGVEKATKDKPIPVTSAVPIATMRELSASRRRAVTVSENGRENRRENGNGVPGEDYPASAAEIENSLGIAPKPRTAGVDTQRHSGDAPRRTVEQDGRNGRRPTGRRRTPRDRGEV